MTTSTLIKGYGPAIRTQGSGLEKSIRQVLEDQELARLSPVFADFTEEHRVVPPALSFPSVVEATGSDPSNIDFGWEIPSVEPHLAFDSFVTGVAVASLVTAPEKHDKIKAALLQIAEDVNRGADLPAVDFALKDSMEFVYRALFDNYEPNSWRPILAFINGAYWLLSHVKDSAKPLVPFGQSPRSFIQEVTLRAAKFGLVPK